QYSLAAHGAAFTPSAAISPYLRQAIVAIEDHRFYRHNGIDPRGILRAAVVDVTQRGVDQGGSTLEEQLAKRAIVGDDATIHGKLRTMAIAWALDQDFSKERILTLYLNDAYYGRGAYGPQEAARTYFGVDAVRLTLPQAAFLAALPQAPSVFGANPLGAAVQSRYRTVLMDMVQQGMITASEERSALDTRLTFALPNP
ncbi:MAG: transglycosylase domain-containing protein, partial [Chloroflexota bacterium]